ncbi:hypothetical protein OKE80_00855 [Riemerella anatipestifer]|uniref:hypothetical protein n=1 Tax=Riemerella anatipestifer TaxID=34085 RepID=UPI0007EDEB74|nr:hypothetical protein [Riemerella anatipestifer]AZZ58377.1 hypothetical protein AWB57_04620 [Riemerella anatipestifer]MCO7317753.1 hypothetical protein [Riemerella anatipestifer]MCW0473379.1 hypothetical protein [Riemerella anatipestifer]MCW0510168.1 hypothetical protein [Riemerella anatipestifer]MCW0518761.1 hypothetical protein [Riemerella anatipestifer]
MNIRGKILDYCHYKRIDLKDFGEKLGLKKSNFSSKMNGKSRFNEEDFALMRKHFPDIDLNNLFEGAVTDSVADSSTENITHDNHTRNELINILKKINSLTKDFK